MLGTALEAQTLSECTAALTLKLKKKAELEKIPESGSKSCSLFEMFSREAGFPSS